MSVRFSITGKFIVQICQILSIPTFLSINSHCPSGHSYALYGDGCVSAHHYHCSLLLTSFPNTISAYFHHTISYTDLTFSPINLKQLESSKHIILIFVAPIFKAQY